MPQHIFSTETRINAPIEKVFAFFSNAHNLGTLTPPELRLKVLTPAPINMKAGIEINYTLNVAGIPLKWRTLISDWNPPYSFVDEQIKGPYIMWVHTHSFVPDGNVTIMTDMVKFLSPGLFLERFVNKWFVEKRVKQIFAYRETVLKEMFPD